MKKNVVWWIGVKNDKYAHKYGGWEWVDISRNTWEYWCKKNDVLFVPFEKPIEEDLSRFRINWQKAIFVFDEMERRGIDYDQICQIDCTHMIKWDAPNFFELTDHKLTAVRDTDNLNWIYKSIMGYKDFFNGFEFDKLPNFEFDKQKYVSSSPMIFNEQHKDVFKSFKKLYYDNVDTFVELQDKIVGKGTEQTPLNYWLQINDVEMNLTLPFVYKLTHIHRKDMFGHNWQLNEDKTPLFINHAYNWVFTGIPKDQRTHVMKQVWDLVKHNYDENFILNRIENKAENKSTTSRKFKEDILRIFGEGYKDKTILELGCHQGNTTRVYAECFKKVIAVERDVVNYEKTKENCSDVNNVEFINSDVYDVNFKIPNVDVVHVDAGHTFEEVVFDIDRLSKQLNNPTFIFDDYGHEGRTVRKAIDDRLSVGTIKLITHIGEDKGFVAGNGKTFIGREGVICGV